MNPDLFDSIIAMRGEPLGWVCAQLHLSPASVQWVWDHETQIRTTDPELVTNLDGFITDAADDTDEGWQEWGQ